MMMVGTRFFTFGGGRLTRIEGKIYSFGDRLELATRVEGYIRIGKQNWNIRFIHVVTD